MRCRPSFVCSFVLLLFVVPARPGADDCSPLDGVEFVCGQAGPEDLAAVPGGEWVIAGGDTGEDGAMRLIRVKDRTTTILFPAADAKERLDAAAYPSCPGPIDAADKQSLKFKTHGLSLRAGRNRVHRLFVVFHGRRESVEVFELDVRGAMPRATWIGCVIAPEPIGLNAVVGLDDGGFIATNYMARDITAAARARMLAGERNGELWEWHRGDGWKKLPGTEVAGPNGLEMSPDGKWLYVAAFGSQGLVRLSRGGPTVQRDEVTLGFRVDNVRWSPDGAIFAAGPGGTAPNQTSNVVKVDVKTLQVRPLVKYPYNEFFRFGTAAIQIGKEIWLGSNTGPRIARFQLDRLPTAP